MGSDRYEHGPSYWRPFRTVHGQGKKSGGVPFAADVEGAEPGGDMPDDDMRAAFADWLWAYVESGLEEGEFDAPPLEADALAQAQPRCWKEWCPRLAWPGRTCSVAFVLGFLAGGIMVALVLGQDAGCSRWWFHTYTDWLWAWKISRWDASGFFAWGDLLSGSALQTCALWAMGALNGPFGAAVLTGMATTFLQSSGAFIPQQAYADTHGGGVSPQQQLLQLQWLHQQNMALQQQQQNGQRGIHWGQQYGHEGSGGRRNFAHQGLRNTRRPRAIAADANAHEHRGKRRIPKITEDQLLALLRAKGFQRQNQAREQKKRQRAWRETSGG